VPPASAGALEVPPAVAGALDVPPAAGRSRCPPEAPTLWTMPAILAPLAPKFLRYCSVSVVSTVTSVAVLGVLVGAVGTPAGWANAVATGLATIPSFELNRRWVWGKGGRRSVTGEVVPFAVLSFLGLGLSTLAVHAAAAWASANGWGDLARTVLVEGSSLGGYGVLWVAQFVLLERVLFRPAPRST
jgi:putative flippase GtrA